MEETGTELLLILEEVRLCTFSSFLHFFLTYFSFLFFFPPFLFLFSFSFSSFLSFRSLLFFLPFLPYFSFPSSFLPFLSYYILYQSVGGYQLSWVELSDDLARPDRLIISLLLIKILISQSGILLHLSRMEGRECQTSILECRFRIKRLLFICKEYSSSVIVRWTYSNCRSSRRIFYIYELPI